MKDKGDVQRATKETLKTTKLKLKRMFYGKKVS